MIDAAAIPVERVQWRPCYRLIPSRYPTVGLYDAIADPADLDVIYAIEALTNPRVREELGELHLVPAEDRVTGAGATFVMAAFTHLNADGSRFSDGSYGVYYAAESLETAVAEVSHHRTIFLSRTAEPAIELTLRLIHAELDAQLHDLRELRESAPEIYDPDHYAHSQALGRTLRGQSSWGVIFQSVRRPEGTCVGLFKPKALSHAKAAAHIALHWDGARISHWHKRSAPHSLSRPSH